MKLAAVAAVLLVASTASAGRGGAIAIPPAEVDVGAGSPIGAAAATGPSTEVLAGIHWASLYWHPTKVDVGFGYVGSFRPVLPGYAARTDAPDAIDNELRLNGGYLSLGYAIESHEHWRTWLDARIETLHASVNQQTFNALGAALRVSTEVFVAGAAGAGGHGGGALVAGTFALGVYVEAVHRDLPAELGPNGVSAGLSMRIPLILAAGG
ncbi:MAG: hypothetical protein JO257_26755 [Deltaproteobacteria bacterium]|nr:hypothetical protein [Deltaproteobacteria bacterium]